MAAVYKVEEERLVVEKQLSEEIETKVKTWSPDFTDGRSPQ